MDRDSQSEDSLSTLVLENIKNRLVLAFRAAGEPRRAPQESASFSSCYQANEELRRAQIDGALTWIRSELVSPAAGLWVLMGIRSSFLLFCPLILLLLNLQLEMRSQDLQLAETLLELNTEIQRLRRESCGGLEGEGQH